MTATDFRRRAAALALPAFPLALLVGGLVSPTDSTDNAAQLQAAAAHAGRWQAAALVELLAAAILALAAFGLVGAVRSRGSALANAGAVLGALGTIGMASIGLRHLYVYGLAAGDRAGALHALARLDGGAGALLLPCMFAAPLALIVLAAAVARAGIAPRWVPVGAFVFFVADMLPLPGAEELQAVVGVAVFAVVAARLLRIERRSPARLGEPVSA